jgi:predicted secreted Zn-dependent protease
MSGSFRIVCAVVSATVLAAAGCAPARPATSAPGVVRRPPAAYHFYTVTGSNPGEIYRSLHEAPAAPGGRSAPGRTNWTITWRAQWNAGAAGCRVTPQVDLQVEVLLPEWNARAGADPQVGAMWDTYVGALSRHEAGHVDIASAGAAAVDRLLRTTVATSCIGMDERLRREAGELIERYRQRDREYDERTRHGATQGATWPPRTTQPTD